MEKPPEPKLDLGWHLAIDLRQELLHLWQQCLLTRDRGIEHRMDHGRALANIRDFLGRFDEDKRKRGFNAVCNGLETTLDEARRRINMARTWDEIREYIEERGLSIPMPRNENHLISLFPAELSQRGEIWVKLYQEATNHGLEVTGPLITQWIERTKGAEALPVPAKVVSVADNEPGLDEDEVEGEDKPERTMFRVEQFLQMREAQSGQSSVLPGMQSGVHAGMAQDPSTQLPAAFQRELSELCSRLPAKGKISAQALYDLWIREFADAPSGLQSAAQSDVAVSGSSSTARKAASVSGAPFKIPAEIKAAIDRIVMICGGTDPEAVQGWRDAISDPIKIKFEDLLLWHQHNEEDVRRIGQLVTGDFGAGLRRAMRIVDRVIDRRTPLDQMISRCIAEGGRWEHIEGSFRIVVTQLKQ